MALRALVETKVPPHSHVKVHLLPLVEGALVHEQLSAASVVLGEHGDLAALETESLLDPVRLLRAGMVIHKHPHTHNRMTGPDCAVMCNFINK